MRGEEIRLPDGRTGIITSEHGGRISVATSSGVESYPIEAIARRA